MAAIAGGGAVGVLSSFQTFVSIHDGVFVNVKVGFHSSSFGTGETSVPMETIGNIILAVMLAQANANSGSVPTTVTVNAPSYLATGTFIKMNLSYTDFSPPPPPPDSSQGPLGCGGKKTSGWLTVTEGLLTVGAAVCSCGTSVAVEGSAAATYWLVGGTVCGVGAGLTGIAAVAC